MEIAEDNAQNHPINSTHARWATLLVAIIRQSRQRRMIYYKIFGLTAGAYLIFYNIVPGNTMPGNYLQVASLALYHISTGTIQLSACP